MQKLASFIVNKRYLLFAIIMILLIASVVMVFFVNINSDILSYLPNGLTMTNGLNFMQTTFGMEGDAIVGVDGVDYMQMQELMSQISQLNGIKPGGAIWIGTIESMGDMSLDVEDLRKQIGYYNFGKLAAAVLKEGININELSSLNMQELSNAMMTNQSLLSVFYPNPNEDGVIVFNKEEKGQYLFMLQLNVASSSDEAMKLLDDIDKILAPYDHAIGGSTEIVREIFSSTINEMYKYVLVAVLVMFIVLLLTTTSLIEPLVFILTIGISIIINLGTNLIFPSVSIVTFACSAVLQLGLSMDYSIFLMHAFADEKKLVLDEKEAMKRAIPKTFTTVTASALTTVGGFLALFAMRFEIGRDLGGVLAKGVALSLLTVIFLQPCLMLMTSKWHKKTEHKIRLPKFKRVASFAISKRKIVVVVALLILIPAIVLQSLESDKLTYIKFVDTPYVEEGSVQDTVNTLSNSIIVMVPISNKEANEGFIKDLENLKNEGKVAAYMSIYTMLPSEYSSLLKLASNKDIMTALQNVDSMAMMSGFVNDGYTLYEVMITCDAESQEAEEIVTNVATSLKNNFGQDEENPYYYTGMAQAVLDLKQITPSDFMWVTIISVLIIFVILIISQKSIKIPTILIAIIELGIFINMALCYIAGEEINFMCYIILSSIQLGATVDYAILYTEKYQANLKIMPANEAAYKALRDSAVSILTSVCIMAGCCLSVTIVASNTIVKQITWLIARGSIISGILTIVVLPAVLVVFTGNSKLKKQGKREVKLEKIINKVKK